MIVNDSSSALTSQSVLRSSLHLLPEVLSPSSLSDLDTQPETRPNCLGSADNQMLSVKDTCCSNNNQHRFDIGLHLNPNMHVTDKDGLHLFRNP